MTELEKMQRAKSYIVKLANGVDPLSDTELPEDTALNNIQLSRCFFYVAEVLERVIQNGGEVITCAEDKAKFEMTEEQKARVSISPEPLGINDFAKRINAAVNTKIMTGVSGVKINDWLVAQGYLTEITAHDRKMRVASPKGTAAGIATIDVATSDGRNFKKNVYSPEMQRFIVEHINQVNTVVSTAAQAAD